MSDIVQRRVKVAKGSGLTVLANADTRFVIPDVMQIRYRSADAIGGLIPEDTLSEDYIVPSVFDKQVVQQVSQAVALVARQTGVARRRSRNEPVPKTS